MFLLSLAGFQRRSLWQSPGWMTMQTATQRAPGTTKYRFYTTLTGKKTKAFFRAMKYTIFPKNTPEVKRCKI